MISSFGNDAIRKFPESTTEMKRLTAHNLENLLQVRRSLSSWSCLIGFQCAIPVFDGLLPEPHNRRILELIFVMAHWHALAKLRIHTDTTLAIMDDTTIVLGHKLRAFQRMTCSAFQTRELRREMDARVRRQVKKKTEQRGSSSSRHPTEQVATTPVKHKAGSSSTEHNTSSNLASHSSGCASVVESPPSNNELQQRTLPEKPRPDATRLPKGFNLNTYKFHALGDYTAAIRQFGTTDSYSTEIVSVT